MKAQRFGRILVALLLGVSIWHTGGCAATNAAFGSMEQMAKFAETAAQQIADQGVLDKYQVDADGQFVNPGVKVSTALKVESDVRLIGVSGQISAAVHGTGTQLPAGLRQSLIEQLAMPISDEQRNHILEILGWNRVSSPHNPPPEPTSGA